MRIGILPVFVGTVVIGGFAAYVFLRAMIRSPDVPVPIQFGVAAIVVGALVLVIKALWNRLRRRSQPR